MVQIVRYGELKPCRTAFIDAHTPGSDQKENFTIIGKGVSESADQHVHINARIGFNTGAAGQPPKCINSLHTHTTAEVFFVLHGRWRFFWGRWGTAGETILQAGDVFNIPTGVFRGFENVGSDYGMIMAILGGDDSGGGVTWAPEVIKNAQQHGLVLAENGVLYDTGKGEQLPSDMNPMPLLNADQLQQFDEPNAMQVVPRCVARYQDMMACARTQPCQVIAAHDALLYDRPGFELALMNGVSPAVASTTDDRHHVLIISYGHWRIEHPTGSAYLSAGDTCLVPPATEYSLHKAMTGEASLFRIMATDDPAGPSQMFHSVHG